MKRKLFLTAALFAGITFSGYSQNCKKFVDYQTKDINIGGIKMALGLGQGANTEASSVTSVMRNASEKLQQLDLIQYNLCNQLKSVKSESVKEKLTMQANNIITKMLNLQGGASTDVTPQTSAPNTQTATIQPAPPAETPDDSQPQPQPVTPVEPQNIDVDITTPCSGENFYSTDDLIRGTGEGWSMDAQMAKRAARTAALEDLAAKIEITVKTLCEDYQISKKNGLDETFTSQLENKTRTVVNQTISGWKTTCEKMRQNQQTKKYTAYVAVEISVKQILDGTYAQLRADAQLAKQLPSKAEFDKKFDEVMGEVEQSNEMVMPEF